MPRTFYRFIKISSTGPAGWDPGIGRQNLGPGLKRRLGPISQADVVMIGSLERRESTRLQLSSFISSAQFRSACCWKYAVLGAEKYGKKISIVHVYKFKTKVNLSILDGRMQFHAHNPPCLRPVCGSPCAHLCCINTRKLTQERPDRGARHLPAGNCNRRELIIYTYSLSVS